MRDRYLQNIVIASGEYDAEKNYWLEKLSDVTIHGFPYDKAANNELRYANVHLLFESDWIDQFQRLSNNSELAAFIILLAGIQYLLYRYTGSDDILTISPVFKQQQNKKYINHLLALRTKFHAEMSCKDLLGEVKKTLSEASKHQNYPIYHLIELLGLPVNTRKFPLGRVLTLLKNVHDQAVVEDDEFDLIFAFQIVGNHLEVDVTYDANLYHEESVWRILAYYQRFFANSLGNPDIKLSEVELISPEERQFLLEDLNHTAVEKPKVTLHQWFEQQANTYHDQFAVVDEWQSLTYQEINQKANQVARKLQSLGVQPDQIVGIMLPRSSELILAELGVLKAGGGFLPIDPEYPEERIRFMLEDSQAHILITRSDIQNQVSFCAEMVYIDEEKIYTLATDNLPMSNEITDLAYVIYTSGSTGKPKGVMVEHGNIMNTILAFFDVLMMTEAEKCIQIASCAFDGSISEIYPTLFVGGTLYIPPNETVKNYEKIEAYMNEHGITQAILPPAYVAYLNPANLHSLKKLITVGAATNWDIVQQWKDRLIYFNGYGPTENAICATIWRYSTENNDNLSVPIGKPIHNVQVYVLDRHGQLAPIGIPGELYVAGASVARGYLNRPELTAEKFVRNPFQPDGRMYRTGDLVRILPNGHVDFLGRIDHQVKIRGFRIELGEIENGLLQHEAIKEVAVIVREDQTGDPQLCAYFVPDWDLDVVEITNYLKTTLPDYMIPSQFVKMDQLPKTLNGKVDLRALPVPDKSYALNAEYVAPATETERFLAEAFSEILGVERVGVNDNFFLFGGRSISAMRLVSKITKTFAIEFSVRQIFEKPTIQEIAGYIDSANTSDFVAIKPVEERAYYPVSSAQKRLYAIYALDPDNTTYNAQFAVELQGELDRERIEATFHRLIARHESLRTSFDLVDGQVVQKIHQDVDFTIGYFDQRTFDPEVNLIMPFDLSQAPLLRAWMIQLGEKNMLLVDMHHIICDGVSLELLKQDYLQLYCGVNLPTLQIQYKDFAVWQNEMLTSERYIRQEQFWLETYQGELPILNLLTDYPRQARMNVAGDQVRFIIDQELTVKVKQVLANNDLTLFMLLLGVYNILLAKYTGQEDIIVGIPITGRTHSDLENIVGMFANTLAIRSYPVQELSFAEYLQEFKEILLHVFENQDYPFERFIDQLDLEKDLSRNPLFDTMFNLHNFHQDVIVDEWDEDLPAIKAKTSMFDIVWNIVETKDKLLGVVEYRTNLFKPATIEKMSEHFLQILLHLVENIGCKIKDCKMLSDEDQNRLVYKYNQTSTPYEQKTIDQLFEEQVVQTPSAIALVCGDTELTYGELNERANQLARSLRSRGIGPNRIVGLLMDHSIEAIMGILGVLKAGGAYLPMDPAYPEERITYMLRDSQAVLCLSQQHLQSKTVDVVETLLLNDPTLYTGDSSNVDHLSTGDDLVYIIYTSGSTGNPKGVMIHHSGLVNYISWASKVYVRGETCAFPLYSSLAFDLTVTSIFTPLISGNRLIIYAAEEKEMRISKIIEDNQVQVIKLTPAHLQIIKYLDIRSTQVKRLIVGGEQFKTELAREIVEKFGGKVELYNEYGPTETVVGCMIHCYHPAQDLEPSVPIGVPADNVQIYLLDQYHNPVAVNVAGEIYIAGAGVARGYLNRPELTVEKFVDNPFAVGTKMYKTGDLGRWLPNGVIEYLGRMDHQVKIRGFRIEIGEIESKLVKHQDISEALVLARESDGGSQYLVAYYIANREIPSAELREYLLQELPEYMVPAYFVLLTEFPLTQSGKIDTRKLAHVRATEHREYVAPTTELEKQLVHIWEKTLGVKPIGVTDNFFELGGDSIKAIPISGHAKQLGLNISVAHIFTYRTIAMIIHNVLSVQHPTLISQDEVHGEVALTPNQIWFLESVGNPHSFFQVKLFTVKEKLDTELLTAVMREVIQHHDSLRMGYHLTQKGMTQFIRKIDETHFEIVHLDLPNGSSAEQDQMIRRTLQKAQNEFDLEADALIQVTVFDLGEDGQRLSIAIHQLIIDQVSWNILIEDLEYLYQTKLQQKLPLKTTSIQDWSAAINSHIDNEMDITYWQRLEPGKFTSLVAGEGEKTGLGLHVSGFELDPAETEQLLGNVNLPYHTQMVEILLSALVLALGETMDLEKLFIRLESHNRQTHTSGLDLSRTVGWLASDYPVYFEKQADLRDTIKHVKENVRRSSAFSQSFSMARSLAENARWSNLHPQIAFYYSDKVKVAGDLLEAYPENSAVLAEVNPQPFTFIRVMSSVNEGRLQITLVCDSNSIPVDIATQLEKMYQLKLHEVIRHCLEQDHREYTPSDFQMERWLDEKEFTYITRQVDVEKVKIYDLTPLQHGMLYHYRLSPESRHYREQAAFYLDGSLDVAQLKAAWEEIARQHEILRTRIIWKEVVNPVQIISEQAEITFTEYDISHQAESEQRTYLSEFKIRELDAEFDFEKGMLNWLSVVKLSETRHFVCWTFHHILLDGWSMTIVLGELFKTYLYKVNGFTIPQSRSGQFSDYLEWLKKQDRVAGLRFWKEYMRDLTEPTMLATDGSVKREALEVFTSKQVPLSAQTKEKMQQFCIKHNITVNALIQTAWGILLQKYNRRDQSCFGMVVSGRNGEVKNIEHITGMFINTLPVVIKTEEEIVRELLEKVNLELVTIRDYEYIPLVEIQRRSSISTPLFNTLIAFENYPVTAIEEAVEEQRDLGQSLHVRTDSVYDPPNFDLTIFIPNPQQLVIEFAYNLEVFQDETIERVMQQWVHLIEQILQNSDSKVNELCLLTVEEKLRYVVEWNNTATDDPKDQTIVELFEKQAAKTPDRYAVTYRDQHLTYQELATKSNQLAWTLREKGVRRDDIVAIMADRSIEMVIGIWAVLRAGGAYLPIDPEYPLERIEYILHDSMSTIILTQSHFIDKVRFSGVIVNLEEPTLYQGNGSALEVIHHPRDLAYIIYTSGSTGNPKGVMVEHQGLVNYVTWANKVYVRGEVCHFPLYSSLAFDLTVTSIYVPLISGNTIVVYGSEDKELSMEQIVRDAQVQVVKLTPAHLQILKDLDLSATRIRRLIVGGEALATELAQAVYRAFSGQVEIYNEYGPTETVVGCMIYRYDPEKVTSSTVPIGIPADNVQIYLVDPHGIPVPVGVPGEICIGGDGVARGYIYNPELTAERFVDNPFQPGSRMYRTGDLARRLPDGNLEFIHRIDHQVKIRGFRIELGEIESQILTYESVEAAAVVVKKDPSGHSFLSAYLVCDGELNTQSIQAHLAQKLPEYMIPTYFTRLEKLPLTSNGKVDRMKLALLQETIMTQAEYVIPTSAMEILLAEIWADVLGVERVGIDDHFYEMGGDSLKAMQVITRLRQVKYLCKIKDIILNPTIRQLTRCVTVDTLASEQGIISGEMELLPIQSEVFGDLHYKNFFSMPDMLKISADVDYMLLKKALDQLVEHHDALRLNYDPARNILFENNTHLEREFELPVYDLSHLSQEEQAQRLIQHTREVMESYDVEQGLLFKACIFELSATDKRIFLAPHHLIADPVSLGILTEDISNFYVQLVKEQKITPPLKTTSWIKWSEEVSKYSQSEEVLQERPYWEDVLSVDYRLPIDFDKGPDYNKDAALLGYTFSEKVTEDLLYKANKAYQTETQDLLLTALAITMKTFTKQNAILVKTQGHGREDLGVNVDLSRTVGWFGTMFPTKLDLNGCSTIGEKITAVRSQLRKVPNKGIGYGLLRYKSQQPLPAVKRDQAIIFDYVGQYNPEMRSDLFAVSEKVVHRPVHPMNQLGGVLTLSSIIIASKLEVKFLYSTTKFKKKTIEKMMEGYVKTLHELIHHCVSQG